MRIKCGSGGVASVCDASMSTQANIERIKANAESGDATAQRQLGWICQTGDGVPKDLAEALKWYRKSAAQGNALAQNDIGNFYENGRVVAQDYVEAMKWYLLSANKGFAYGQHNLARFYYNGHGTSKNYVEAAKWFGKAAEQGHSTAAYFLGWLYSTGNGVEKNYTTALFWYRKAASDGIAGAQNNLAVMIENGQGVAPNINEAIKWYRKSAEQGDAAAKKALERLKVPLEEPKAAPVPANKNRDWQRRAPSHESAECQPLVNACTPEVYLHNAFRITGLLVDASTRDIKRRVDDLKAAAEIGDDEDEYTHAFALNPTPGIDRIRDAAQRLFEPERRIIEEFFWFWPLDWDHGGSDSALSALRNGDKDIPFKIWSEAVKEDEEPISTISKHNLAVMYQMVALDSELLALKNDFSQKQLDTVVKYWSTSFKWWEELATDETFWSLVSDRIRRLDDHRLTTGFARRMRGAFPVAFDRINAMLAMQYAERGKYDHARRHIAYMNETHQGSDDVDRVISEIFKPLETRINSAVDEAVRKGKEDPSKSADAVRQLLDATGHPLVMARSLLEDGHAIRSYLFEHVYDTCFNLLIAYGNKTEDWPTCVALLKLTEPLAVTPEARERIRTNIKQAEENQKQKDLYETCWFCKRAKAEAAHVLEVPMHGNVQRQWQVVNTRVTWRTMKAKVPRCKSCKEAHGKVAGMWTGAAAGAAIGTAILPVIGSAIGLFAGGALGKMVDKNMRLPEGIAPESAKANYPPIQELVHQGWAFGERPT